MSFSTHPQAAGLTVWRYLLSILLLLPLVAADEVIVFGNNETVPVSGAQLLIYENPLLITANGPGNGTIADRDAADATDADTIALNVTVPSYVPDGTVLEFRANLTGPIGIAGTSEVLLGTNATVGGSAVLYYDPNGSSYAGNWTWFGAAYAGTPVSFEYFIAKGALQLTFANNTYDPNSTYRENDSISFSANLTSSGPETRDDLFTYYNISVLSTLANMSTSSTVGLSYASPFWAVTQSALNVYGVGDRNVSVNATDAYWYDAGDIRTSTIYGLMNITANTTAPATIGLNEEATTTCAVTDQFTQYPVPGATVAFYRNGSSLGTNDTDSTGIASLTFSTGTYGDFIITCNVSDQLAILYYAGSAPEGNSTLSVVSTPPSFVTGVIDYSDSTTPTNETSNVTFTANATDAEGEQWRLIVCSGSEGIIGTSCADTAVCSSGLVNNGTNASCSYNTTGELAQTVDWWAYACDSANSCSAYNNATSPYEVNHAPHTAPALSASTPTINDIITCVSNAGDNDIGDTLSLQFTWYRSDEGTGPFTIISGATSNQLAYPQFDSNDQVLCSVQATDNHNFAGAANNTTIATVLNGTLSASASLNTSSVIRTYHALLTVSCTVTDGDSESVSLTVQDNHTGVYAQSSTSAAAVYVNASSIALGAVANTTSSRSVLVSTQTSGSYGFRAVCQASDTDTTVANSSIDTLSVVPDTTPPVITAVFASPVATSATISWDTDDSSDSTVDYGLSPALGLSVQSPTLTTSHSLDIVGLNYSTTYYYTVSSCNSDGYCNSDGPYSFVSSSSDDVATPVTKGYCTAVVVERRSSATGDQIGKGDIVEFYCELPNRVYEQQDLGVTVANSEQQASQNIKTPDPIFGSRVVLYP